MKITNKKTGHSFNMSGKGAADFFYAKNANGERINKQSDYSLNDDSKEISQIKFFFGCFGLMALCLGSFLLYLHLNY
jgi:hypothetical protein|tara:strand:+ start:69 stop:299 length:231 start_codon:yes stop_codon:yes gene_type:complete